MDALEKLERQGQDENAIMRQLTEKSTRDSSSMRILTIITMIYLPCTIVSVGRVPFGTAELEHRAVVRFCYGPPLEHAMPGLTVARTFIPHSLLTRKTYPLVVHNSNTPRMPISSRLSPFP